MLNPLAILDAVSDTPSWLPLVGGTAGLLALLGMAAAWGRFTAKVSTLEEAVADRPTRAEVKNETRSINHNIDEVRRDIRQIRDILIHPRK